MKRSEMQQSQSSSTKSRFGLPDKQIASVCGKPPLQKRA